MGIDTITQYFVTYGGLAVFVIVLLEYLNLPGFPAGIIMPLAGIWAAKGGIGFAATITITVLAGLLGSWILYFIGRIGGKLFLDRCLKRFPKQEPAITRAFDVLRSKGYIGIFVSKLLPMIRTLISIPAGILRMNFVGYTVSSVLGIFVWNLVFVGAGYVMGDTVLQLFS